MSSSLDSRVEPDPEVLSNSGENQVASQSGEVVSGKKRSRGGESFMFHLCKISQVISRPTK